MGPRGPQGGPGAWNSQQPGPLGFGPQMTRRLGLTDDQVQKIRDILEKSRLRIRAAIKDVLTEEQAAQFDQMSARAGRMGRGRGGSGWQDGPRGPANRRFQQNQGPDQQSFRPRGRRPGAQMGPQGQGQGSDEQSFRPRGRRPGAQMGPRGQEQGPDQQSFQPRGRRPGAQMRPQGQGSWQRPFQGGPGAGRAMGRRGQMSPPDVQAQPPVGEEDGENPAPSPSLNRNMPPIEQMFDQADTNHDGALTKEELRAFHENMGPRPGWRRQ